MAVNPQAVVPPLPAPVPPFWKFVIWIAETVATGIIWKQLDGGGEMQPTSTDTTDPSADVWVHIEVRAECISSQQTKDDTYFSFDFVNITNGSIDSSWTPEDFGVLIAYLTAFYPTVQAYMNSNYSITETRAYFRAFNSYSNAKPFANSGPPEMVWTHTLPGSGLGNSAPQACSTLTEITPSRLHWGRTYLPPIGTSSIATTSRMESAQVNAIASAAHTMYEGLAQNEFFAVVPVTQTTPGGKGTAPVPTRVLLGVNQVQVDDVIDVIRRRRYASPLLKVSHPVAGTAEQQPAAEEQQPAG